MNRTDHRLSDSLRPIKFTPNYQEFALSSVLVEMGKTKVICAVSVEEKVPPFMRGGGQGWLSVEYAMLPGSTDTRTLRDEQKTNGRNKEIQRLIGRALRSVLLKKKLGERTLQVDCDVLQADGGTRTASINGAYVAVYLACLKLIKMGVIGCMPLVEPVAAVSCGLLQEELYLDLSFSEDSVCECDFNIAMTESGKIVEIQASAEKAPFSQNQLDAMIKLAQDSLELIFAKQKEIIEFCKKENNSF